MAVTYTARHGLPQWGAPEDPWPGRPGWNGIMATLDTKIPKALNELPATAPVALGGNRVTNMGAGTAAGDAVNKGQLDAVRALSPFPVVADVPFGGKKITNLAAGTAAGDAVNKSQLDNKSGVVTLPPAGFGLRLHNQSSGLDAGIDLWAHTARDAGQVLELLTVGVVTSVDAATGWLPVFLTSHTGRLVTQWTIRKGSGSVLWGACVSNGSTLLAGTAVSGSLAVGDQVSLSAQLITPTATPDWW